jgi:hypothetical protein
MNKTVRNVIKTGLLFAAVGVTLALAVPYLAAAVGLEAGAVGVMANPAWLGVFFGGMGVLDACMRPSFDKFFDEKPQPDSARNITVRAHDLEHSPALTRQSTFAQKISDERKQASEKNAFSKQ